LKSRDLPRNVDKDPTWRADAVFTRDELERLLFDERVPVDRRVLYAVLGLAGLRFGEASALRWRSYDAAMQPLGRLLITSAWSTTHKQERPTKCEQPRLGLARTVTTLAPSIQAASMEKKTCRMASRCTPRL
jgi:hypothetical protein